MEIAVDASMQEARLFTVPVMIFHTIRVREATKCFKK